MMDQPTFADVDYTSKKRKTRRERFLDRMDGLIPWDTLPLLPRTDAQEWFRSGEPPTVAHFGLIWPDSFVGTCAPSRGCEVPAFAGTTGVVQAWPFKGVRITSWRAGSGAGGRGSISSPPGV